MKKTMMGVVALAVLALAGGYYAASYDKAPMEKAVAVPVKNDVAVVTEQEAEVAIQPSPFDIAKAMEDRPKGDANAPITVIEYASMTCPHCAEFNNNALPVVQKELIDTGKIRMIYRDFPLDRFAVKAAMLTRCAPPEKYHDLVNTIFKEQAEWVKMPDPLKGLTDIGVRAGMDAADIAVCFGNNELQDALMASMKDAQATMQVQRTPSFFFKKGEEWLETYPEFQEIQAAHDSHKH